MPFPILFFIGLTLLPEIRFARHYSNLSFRLLIPDRCRRFFISEAIRSVTHLVLAPDREDFLSFLYKLPRLCLGLSCDQPVRPSRFCGTRKRSVPVRVHSVSKSSGFADASSKPPASNPLLTHGTVESPAKHFLKQFHCPLKEECGRLQSVLRALRQPLSLAGGRAPKLEFHCVVAGCPNIRLAS